MIPTCGSELESDYRDADVFSPPSRLVACFPVYVVIECMLDG